MRLRSALTRCKWQAVRAWLQVLPPLVCYCDQDWYASILTSCRMDGSDLALPFECPLDTILNPGNLDASPLRYRMQSYLADARTPGRVKRSQEAVAIDANEAWVAFQQRHSVGAGGFVAAGADAACLRAALAEAEAAHVLNFRGLRPGSFASFGSATEDNAFDQAFAAAVGDEARWCCRCVSSFHLARSHRHLISDALTSCVRGSAVYT